MSRDADGCEHLLLPHQIDAQRRVDEEGLRLLRGGAARGRISDVADAYVTVQQLHGFLGEDVLHQAVVL